MNEEQEQAQSQAISPVTVVVENENETVKKFASAVDQYSDTMLNKISTTVNMIPEVRTLGVSNESLKKIFTGVGILSALMFAKKNKVVFLSLLGGLYVYKTNSSKISEMAKDIV